MPLHHGHRATSPAIPVRRPSRQSPFPRQRRLTRDQTQGFSLFEVLVVIAVIALITGIITVNFNRLIPALEHKPLERVLIESLQDARILAATSGNTVLLSFDPDSQSFLISERSRPTASTGEDAFAETPPAPEPIRQGFSGRQQTQVLFYPRLAQSNRMSARALEFSRDPAPYLVFHPSGVSTPARVVIQRPGSEDQEVILDAFSSGPPDTPHT